MEQNKKRIKIIGTAYPFRGGLAAYNERLAKEFISQRHTVDIETFTIQYPGILFPGKTQYADWEAPSDLNICRTVNSINPINWIITGKRIKKEKPDLLIIKYWIPFMAPCFGTIIKQVKRNKHTKVICVADNIIPHEKRPGDKILTRYFMNSIDAIVAMSESVLDDINLFSKTIPRALCPHPIFDNFGEKIEVQKAKELLNIEQQYNYLLFFGFIRDYKGLDILLKAFADKRLKTLPVKLIIAGEFYTNPEPYHKLISELKLNERIILRTDFIPDSEVNRYFCAADLVVQPYKNATQSGITQIGYHFEKPMLVTNVGGLPEIIPDKKIGYVVEPNEKKIADSILDFYQNNRKEKFGKNVIIEKKKFSWDNMTNAIFEVYNKTKAQ